MWSHTYNHVINLVLHTLEEGSYNGRFMKDLSLERKRADIQTILDRWACRFPLMLDEAVFREKDRIVSIMEDDFIAQRSALHIVKLACKIRFVRRRLAHNSSIPFTNDHFDVQALPFMVDFSGGSKHVLGIIAHAEVQNQYEHFYKKQVLNIIKRLFPDIQLVTDSVYEIHPPKSTIQTVYFEICKQNDLPFSREEIRTLKTFVQEKLPYSIEKVSPHLFMVRNEEEIFKDIFTLSREIQHLSDHPQAIIMLDQQTSSKVEFTIVLVYARKLGQPSLKETLLKYLSNPKEPGDCQIDRCQTVRYIGKRHPVEAIVIRIRLDKQSFPLRTDGSLHFHLVRQRAGHMLNAAIGPFRDYNGGIIATQMELLSSLKEAFPGTLSDLLENFYHSLNPLEAQATLSLDMLKAFFELFLVARNTDLKKQSDFFVQFKEEPSALFIAIRVLDANFILTSEIFVTNRLHSIVSCTLADQGAYFHGYLIPHVDSQTGLHLKQRIIDALESWKKETEKRRVLRLNLLATIASLDPRIGGDKHSSTILKMLFEGLMRFNRNGLLEHGLAEKVEISEDQKLYTFTLREAFWSNGSQVTANDFAYAWKKILSPSFNTSFAYLFYAIKNARLAKCGAISVDHVGIRALNAQTLQVELEFPAPYFLEATALTIYSPVCSLVDQQSPNWALQGKERYVCNGAFCLKSNDLNEQHILAKNSLYWDQKSIQLDEVLVLKADLQNPFEMFRRGMVDWVGTLLKSKTFNYIPGTDEERITAENTGVFWIVFNTKRSPSTIRNCAKRWLWGSIGQNYKNFFTQLQPYLQFPLSIAK